MELDDWDLSAEQLDSLEKDAFRQIAQRNPSSCCTSTSTSTSSYSNVSSHVSQQRQNPQHHLDPLPRSDLDLSPIRPRQMPAVHPQVDACPPQPKVLPTSMVPKSNDDSAKQSPNLCVKILLHCSGNLAAKFPYDQVLITAVRKIPKASWSTKERLWMFPVASLSSAEKILSEIPGCKVEYLDPLVHRALTSVAKAPDLQDRYGRIPDCIESKLLPFQKDGVRFMLQHGGRVLLADEMGLGKTLQAIAVTACVQDSWPVLVLTPSSLRLHWATMIHQWMNIPPSDIVVVLPQWGGSNRCGFRVAASNKGVVHLDGVFNIVSYDSVTKLQNALLASHFKVVVADESHYLKNAQAKRTSASIPVIQRAQYAILLSGTPALSRPIELHKQLEALYPDVYKNVHEYGNRYCKGGIFGVYQGASNHEELHNLMKATVMIRRLKKDVLSELPMKRRQQVFLDLAEKDMRQINALFRELEVMKAKMKNCKAKDELDSLKLLEKNIINKIYNESAEAKIPAVLDYLGTVIEKVGISQGLSSASIVLVVSSATTSLSYGTWAGCKFLIFAHHQSMIDSVHQFLQKKKVGCIRIDGGTPPTSRQSLVADFQEKESIKAAVLSIRAAGVGLTLTAASTVFFAELSWTPGDLIQAEDRAHRIGQASSVNVYYLLAKDTVDDIIWDVVQSKLENLGQVLDGKENVLEVSDSKPMGSPAKQKTLDSFLKRCSSSSESEAEPKPKFPRR